MKLVDKYVDQLKSFSYLWIHKLTFTTVVFLRHPFWIEELFFLFLVCWNCTFFFSSSLLSFSLPLSSSSLLSLLLKLWVSAEMSEFFCLYWVKIFIFLLVALKYIRFWTLELTWYKSHLVMVYYLFYTTSNLTSSVCRGIFDLSSWEPLSICNFLVTLTCFGFSHNKINRVMFSSFTLSLYVSGVTFYINFWWNSLVKPSGCKVFYMWKFWYFSACV